MMRSTLLSLMFAAIATLTSACGSCGKSSDSSRDPTAASPQRTGSPLTDPLGGDIPQRDAPCRACRAVYCTKYDGVVDLVSTCFGHKDPEFVKTCTATQNCAYEKKCGYKVDGAMECFCGSADVATCLKPGAANGPCQSEWLAAAHTQSVAELAERFGDLSLPAGISSYLLACDRDYCKMCKPSGL